MIDEIRARRMALDEYEWMRFQNAPGDHSIRMATESEFATGIQVNADAESRAAEHGLRVYLAAMATSAPEVETAELLSAADSEFVALLIRNVERGSNMWQVFASDEEWQTWSDEVEFDPDYQAQLAAKTDAWWERAAVGAGTDQVLGELRTKP